jgi:hypothetical protein
LLPIQPEIEMPPPMSTPPSSVEHDTEWPPIVFPSNSISNESKALVSAKRSEAEDHIWSLREDPGYFRDSVNIEADHRYEHLRNHKTGRTHSRLGSPIFWAEVQRHVVINAYRDLMLWDTTLTELSRLLTIRARYGRRIQPGKHLPDEYAYALHSFKLFIEESRHEECLSRFYMITPCSPPLRERYVRRKCRDPNDPIKWDIQCKDLRKFDYFMLLLEFFTDPKRLVKIGFAELLDKLDRVTRSDSNGGRGAQS